MTCLVPDAGVVMSIGQIFFCIGEILFGDPQFAGLVFILIVSFLMWRLGLNLQAAYPISLLLLFALGSATYGIGKIFTSLLWLWVISFGIIFLMGFLNWARR
jgi:hypothetical protein